MSNTKHTPGPWKVDIDGITVVADAIQAIQLAKTSLSTYIEACRIKCVESGRKHRSTYKWRKALPDYKEDYSIEECKNDILLLEEQQRANAKLIAAAPELLKALNSLVLSVMAHPDYTGEENEEWTDLIETAEEAIKKATE